MILYIVRHAWAGEHDPQQWPDDRQRPLTERGIRRFRRAAKRLAKRGLSPEQVATSPLVRCVQTAEILCNRLGHDAPIVVEALSPGARLESVLAATDHLDADEIAWVGHAPDVGQMVARLIDGSGSIEMSKGAVAAIEFDGRPRAGAGSLQWLVTAGLLNV
ncbi:MAG TPA: phosphohistidine phosphatase SixA [Pirellulales bacterium]|jgi:phosphohistidine phosphatase|nr:phosphohistidine phosphatase SixA [Pirellulales bacterium]